VSDWNQGLTVIQEMRFNVHLDPGNRIHRVVRLKPKGDRQEWATNAQAGIAPAMDVAFPEIERAFK